MKKLIALFLAFTFVFALAACDNVPEEILDCLDDPSAEGCEVCDEGYELEGTECVLIDPDPEVCETGYHEEAGECVIDEVDPLVCETGYHEETGECVLDEVDPLVCETGYIELLGQCVPDPSLMTQEEIIANAITANLDGSLSFLASAMANMDFSTALTLTTEFYFEVEEDSEVHSVHAVIEDSFLYAETGDTVKRVIDLDFDGQMIEFTIILQEVETGVHVFIEPQPLIDAIAEDNPDVADYAAWVGFESDWAVFEFDDSLEAVIELEVLKEMIVSLFFSEMGENFFDEFQEELEYELGFDLNQYNVDLGLIIDYLIEEDFINVEAQLEGIDVEGIVLNLDYLYLAPALYELLMEFETELATALFDTAKLDVLQTSVWNESTEEFDYLIDPILDPAAGTEVFFNSLTPAEVDTLIEVVIKPIIEHELRQNLIDQVNGEFDEIDLHNFISNNSVEFGNQYPGFILVNENADIDLLGSVEYWKQLTVDEKNYFYSFTCEPLYEDGYPVYDEWGEVWTCDTYENEIIEDIENRIQFAEDFEQFLITHELLLEGYSIDVDALLLSITNDGVPYTIENVLTDEDIEKLLDAELYPLVEGLHQAIIDEEVFEFVVNELFTNPHVVAFLAEDLDAPFDEDMIAANMLLIDFDAWVLEELDVEAFATAVYEGQTSYDTYILALATTSPNWALLLEPWSPGVLELEDYMMYVDDLMYAFDGLIEFEQFIDPAYYLDEIVNHETEVTEDFEILTTIELDGQSYTNLFNDLKESLGLYLGGFETIEDYPYNSEWECIDPLDEDCEEPNFAEIIAALYSQGSLEATILFDPSDMNWIEFGFDATDFLDTIVSEENPGDSVNEFSITITMENTAAITVPVAADSVNDIVEDFTRFGVSMFGYDILRELGYYYEMNPSELLLLIEDDVTLDTFEFLNVSQAFDSEMSFVTVTYALEGLPLPGGTVDPDSIDFELTLYWIDGTEVFDSPIGLSEWASLMFEGNLTGEAAYDTMVANIDDDNFAMTKVWLMFMWQQDDYEEEYYPE